MTYAEILREAFAHVKNANPDDRLHVLDASGATEIVNDIDELNALIAVGDPYDLPESKYRVAYDYSSHNAKAWLEKHPEWRGGIVEVKDGDAWAEAFRFSNGQPSA